MSGMFSPEIISVVGPTLAFKDRAVQRRKGVLAVGPQGEAGQVGWRLKIRRAG